MPICDFNNVAGCSPVNFPHIFRTLFSKNTSGGLVLKIFKKEKRWQQYRKLPCVRGVFNPLVSGVH